MQSMGESWKLDYPHHCISAVFLEYILFPLILLIKPSLPIFCYVLTVVYPHSLILVTSCSQPMSRQLFSPIVHKQLFKKSNICLKSQICVYLLLSIIFFLVFPYAWIEWKWLQKKPGPRNCIYPKIYMHLPFMWQKKNDWEIQPSGNKSKFHNISDASSKLATI